MQLIVAMALNLKPETRLLERCLAQPTTT